MSGSSITIYTIGSTTITASQAGNDDFFAAPDVSQVLVIHDVTQTIAFSNPGSKVLGDPGFHLTATSSSGLEVVYTTTSDKILIDGSHVTILKAGKVTISANQTGSDNFEPATPVEVSFCINPPRIFRIFEGGKRANPQANTEAYLIQYRILESLYFDLRSKMQSLHKPIGNLEDG